MNEQTNGRENYQEVGPVVLNKFIGIPSLYTNEQVEDALLQYRCDLMDEARTYVKTFMPTACCIDSARIDMNNVKQGGFELVFYGNALAKE